MNLKSILDKKKVFQKLIRQNTIIISLWNLVSAFIPALIITLIVIALLELKLLDGIQDSFADQLLYSGNGSTDVIILAIDDTSLQKIGRWPWDRDVIAQIQSKLEQYNPKVIAWDIGFFETSISDEKFSQALESDIETILASEIAPSVQYGYLSPISIFQKENVSYGYINLKPDRDGKIRSTHLFSQDIGGECRKSFSFSLYEKYSGLNFNNPCEHGLSDIPLINGNELIINYAGPPGTFLEISASEFLEKNVVPQAIENKAVIVGVTAKNLQDYKPTPTSSSFMTGAEIMGNIFHTLDSRNFLYRETLIQRIFAIFTLSIFTALLMRGQKIFLGSIITLAILNIYFLFTLWQFSNGIIMDIIYLPITGLVSWILQVIILYYKDKKNEEYIRGAFGQYVSEEILKEILKDPDKLALGGDSKIITVLFSDIRGFTTYAEKLSPKSLVDQTNDYLTKLSEVILRKNGFIDKFLGDGIMAFWGAPIDDPNHAYNACITAIEMSRGLKKWKKQSGQAQKEFNMGVGINTGKMVVGNIGSRKKFSYTVLGDSVNLGSRIEGLTKIYNVPIIISQNTYKRLVKTNKIFNPNYKKDGDLIIRELDTVRVKGRDAPVQLYEVIDIYKHVDKGKFRLIRKFEDALNCYKKGQWIKAKQLFEKLKDKDPAVDIFLERVEILSKQRSGNWDGIWRMQTK